MQLNQNPIITGDQDGTLPAQIVPPKKEKKLKQSTALKAEHFQKINGLRKLYEMTNQLNMDKADLNVQNTMKKIALTLKNWQFQMFPTYQFDLFLQRAQVLGSQKTLNGYMRKVRNIHKGQDKWQDIQERKEGNQNPNQANYGSGEAMSIKFRQSLNILGQKPNNENYKNPASSEDEEDLMELMMKMEKKKQKKQNKLENDEEQEFNQQYVPQGFNQQYGSDSD